MSTVKSVFSVEHLAHIRYMETTMSEIQPGDTFVAYFSDLGADYRIHAVGYDARGQLLCTSTLSKTRTLVPVLGPTHTVYRIFG